MSVKITVQDALSQVDLLFKPRVAALVSSATAFQSGDGVDKAMKIHAEALLVKEGMDKLVPYATNIQRPVSAADGSKVINVVKELQRSWDTVLDTAVKKKGLLDALPVGNLAGLLAEDLKLNHQSMLTLSNALLDAAPAEVLVEGKKLQKELEDTMKKTLAVYQ
ncbi:hypothetical protein NP233_g8889 [Leucocoprinus birnbaumii]|uniref:Uncharacterized protein n=1 Tax=Leucocoprinus birnbaumii TaxID=56174 RepID=A0AAD5VLK4_9AGAR|nr:hypothetical protein NP233_g8889 [Leucocoprinus birnbaumii]